MSKNRTLWEKKIRQAIRNGRTVDAILPRSRKGEGLYRMNYDNAGGAANHPRRGQGAVCCLPMSDRKTDKVREWFATMPRSVVAKRK